MTRILLVAAIALFVLVALRRAFAAGRASVLPERGSRPSGAAPRQPRTRSAESPDRLVCGACGEQFDPEKSGWICPRCGK